VDLSAMFSHSYWTKHMLSGMAQGHVSIEKIDICLKMSTLE